MDERHDLQSTDQCYLLCKLLVLLCHLEFAPSPSVRGAGASKERDIVR